MKKSMIILSSIVKLKACTEEVTRLKFFVSQTKGIHKNHTSPFLEKYLSYIT